MDKVELAPLRPLDDFLLQTARFQVPVINDPERWANRVTSNLLYYQTNYMLLAGLIFLLVGVFHPVQMIFGCAAVVAAFGLFVFSSNNQAQLRRFKRQHPGICLVAILVSGYIIIHLFGSVIVFLFGIALPLLVILVHASLRLRNIKNKIATKVEYVGINRTPMGVLLEALGMESEAGS